VENFSSRESCIRTWELATQEKKAWTLLLECTGKDDPDFHERHGNWHRIVGEEGDRMAAIRKAGHRTANLHHRFAVAGSRLEPCPD